MHSSPIVKVCAFAGLLGTTTGDPIMQYTSRNSKTGITKNVLARSPFPSHIGAVDDCPLSNQLAWDISCPGASDSDCGSCTCDNDCIVRDCGGVKDQNGKFCSSNCQCQADGNKNAPPTAGSGGGTDTFDAAGRNTGTSNSVNTGGGSSTTPGNNPNSGSGGSGGNLEDGGE